MLSSRRAYRLHASVDSDSQARHMIKKFCEKARNGAHFVAGLKTVPPTDEELERVGQQIEDEYQSIKRATGGSV